MRGDSRSKDVKWDKWGNKDRSLWTCFRLRMWRLVSINKVTQCLPNNSLVLPFSLELLLGCFITVEGYFSQPFFRLKAKKKNKDKKNVITTSKNFAFTSVFQGIFNAKHISQLATNVLLPLSLHCCMETPMAAYPILLLWLFHCVLCIQTA